MGFIDTFVTQLSQIASMLEPKKPRQVDKDKLRLSICC